MSRTRKRDVWGHTNPTIAEWRFEFHLLNVLHHCVTTSGTQTAPPGSFNRARSLLQIKFQLFRDPAVRKMSKRGCPRACSRGYMLFIKKFRLPNVLPCSDATRQNRTAGPEPFERARPLLQIKFSLLRDPAIRESSSGSARRRSIVGGNITRVLSTLYLPKLVIRGRRLQTFKSARQFLRIAINCFCALRFVTAGVSCAGFYTR